MVSAAEMNAIVDECFSGERDRDCGPCPANMWNSGECCFGDPDKHDEDDEDCTECDFYDDCRAEVRRVERRSEKKRVINRGDPKSRYAKRPEGLVQIGGLRRSDDDARPVAAGSKLVEVSSQRGVDWGRFWKNVLWGAIQGFLQMALDFFRNHRLK